MPPSRPDDRERVVWSHHGHGWSEGPAEREDRLPRPVSGLLVLALALAGWWLLVALLRVLAGWLG